MTPTDQDIAWMSIETLSTLIRSRRISSAEATDAMLRRIARLCLGERSGNRRVGGLFERTGGGGAGRLHPQ
ncbi:MAG: hypothetical protein NTV19_16875, partial [Burkholderiales bacterium]|nr:hypothetical protein [Burkholderiales bacterium]